MILDIYKKVFERVFIWSPSIEVDSIWLPVKKYTKHQKKVDTDKEKCWFEELNVQDLEKIIDAQHKTTEYSKKHKMRKLFPILLVLDDIADDPKIARYSKLLNSVDVRGRHNGISVVTSVQKCNALNILIRVNATHFSFYIQNFKEIDLLQEELRALPRKANLQETKNLYIRYKKLPLLNLTTFCI